MFLKNKNIIKNIKVKKMRIFNIKYKCSLIFKRPFFSNVLRPDERIGAHNRDVISLIIGSLLGNAYMEKRKNGTRIIFKLCNNNVQYLMWLHKFFLSRGYCSYKKKKLSTKISKKNKVLFKYSFKTYTFTSFNWLYEMFYENGIKSISLNDYLIPLILFAWFINEDQTSKNFTFKISDNDLNYLFNYIRNNSKLNTRISLTKKGSVSSIKKFIDPFFTKK